MKYLVCVIFPFLLAGTTWGQNKFIQNQTDFAQDGGLNVKGLVKAGSISSGGSLQFYKGLLGNYSGSVTLPLIGDGVYLYSVDNKLRIYSGRAASKAIVFNELNTADRTYTFPDITGSILTDNSPATLTNKTWNGAVIASQYGGTGLNSLGAPNQLLRVSAGGTSLEYFTPAYLTSYQETDPLFYNSAAFSIDNLKISNWNSAYSWGNHLSAGYLTAEVAKSTYVGLTGTYNNPPWITGLDYSKISGRPNTLAGYGISDGAINSQVVHKTGDEFIAGIKVFNDNLGIGISNPGERLEVAGKIKARAIKVQPGSWSDFVFQKDYVLLPLAELEKFINQNKHLPGIPVESEVKNNGIDLGSMNARLLQKIEELTLYMIEQDKKVNSLMAIINEQQEQINGLKKQMDPVVKPFH